MARLDLAALAAKEEAENQKVEPQPPAPVEPVKEAAPARKPRTTKSEAKPAPAKASPAPVAPAKDEAPSTAKADELQAGGASTSEDGKVGVPVHLPDDVNDRLLAYMELTGRSHPVILLDAFETVYEDLPQLLQEKLGGDERPKTSLFQRSTRQAPKTKPGDNPHKHTVRIEKSERAVLDSLTTQFAAPSRNFLIIAAYNGYLPPMEKLQEDLQRQRDEEAQHQEDD